MSMTDPIADMLTRIRNACGSKHRRVDMPLSKMKTEIARILKENNYIQDYATVETEEGKKLLRVRLKYAAGCQPVIRALQRVSTPGLRQYVGVTEVPRVRKGLGIAILSTSKGLMSGLEARQAGTGGEPLALIWYGATSHVTNRKSADRRPERRHGHAQGRQRHLGEGPEGRAHPLPAGGHDGGPGERAGDRHAP